MAKQSYWPAPVYVGKFSDGTEGRMSFWSQEGKAIDVARGRRLVSASYRMDVIVPQSDHAKRWRGTKVVDTGRKLVSGHVEFNGETIPDTMGEVVAITKRPPAKKLAKLALEAIARGDVEAARAALQQLAA